MQPRTLVYCFNRAFSGRENWRLVGIRAERETIFALARRSEISDDRSRALVREIDLLEERLAKADVGH